VVSFFSFIALNAEQIRKKQRLKR